MIGAITLSFANAYEDPDRAAAYAHLEFPGTYYLAYRDLPQILGVGGGETALDFGCGTGRSTRFLASLGFDAVGVDISREMLEQARLIDSDGDYRLIEDGGTGPLGSAEFAVILAAFSFDNISGLDRKQVLLGDLRDRLVSSGRIVLVVSSPEIYVNEWASFTTCDYPANRDAVSGDLVRIVMKDVQDARALEDVLCTDHDYRRTFAAADLTLLNTLRPLGTDDEPFDWISETEIAAWTIYVLDKSG